MMEKKLRIKVKANWIKFNRVEVFLRPWNFCRDCRHGWETRREEIFSREPWARLCYRTSLRRSPRNAQSLQATCWVHNCAKTRSWLLSQFSRSFRREKWKSALTKFTIGKIFRSKSQILERKKSWNTSERVQTCGKKWKIPQQIALHWIKQTTNRELNQRSILERWENAFFYWFSQDSSL